MIFKRRRRAKYFENKFSVQLADQKTRYLWWQRLLFWFLVLLLITGFWYLFLSGNFTVEVVQIEGVKTVSVERIEQMVDIKGQNILLLNADKSESELESITEIKNVTLIRMLPKTVRLIISEREPVMIWQTTNKLFAVDRAGLPFREVSEIEGGLFMVVDTANIHVNIGEQLAPRSFVQAYLALLPDLKEIYQDQLSHFEIGETVYDLDAVIKDGRRVKLNVLSNVSNQLAELKRIANERPDLFARQVVDLRVDRWAYIQ